MNFTDGAKELAEMLEPTQERPAQTGPPPAVEAEMGSLVGSIFYTSWGYDQTNVEFFEAVAETKSRKSVVLRALRSVYMNGREYPAQGADRFTTDWHLMGNPTVWDEFQQKFVPNPVRARDEARGYSEKMCRVQTGYHGLPALRLDDVRRAWLYAGSDGVYSTSASGGVGH